jgi:hypothetical protein
VGESGAERGAKAGEIHEWRSEERRPTAPASSGIKGGAAAGRQAACEALEAVAPPARERCDRLLAGRCTLGRVLLNRVDLP